MIYSFQFCGPPLAKRPDRLQMSQGSKLKANGRAALFQGYDLRATAYLIPDGTN
jgi:hypothetical protein